MKYIASELRRKKEKEIKRERKKERKREKEKESKRETGKMRKRERERRLDNNKPMGELGLACLMFFQLCF